MTFLKCSLKQCLLAAFSFPLLLQAQDLPEFYLQKLDQEKENIVSAEADEELSAHYTYLLKHPINLNKATDEQLEHSRLFNPIQINALIQHKKVHGDLVSVYELESIPGFEPSFIESILPLISVEEKNFEVFRRVSSIDIGYRQILEQQKGSENDSSGRGFTGSPFQCTLKFKSIDQKLSYGLVAEKDAGEGLFNKYEPYGFDYYSGFVKLNGKGLSKQLIVGDYESSFGQGLISWHGFSFRKSSDVTELGKPEAGIKEHLRTDEVHFLRGLAYSIGSRHFRADFFVSSRLKDGITGSNQTLSSFQTTGLHRTISELSHRNAFNEKIAGTHIQSSFSHFTCGLTAISQNLSLSYAPSPASSNLFASKGNTFYNIGADYSWLFRNFALSGELACAGDGLSTIHNLLLALDKDLALALSYRNYSSGFSSIDGSAYGSGTGGNNETGFTCGLKINITPKLVLNAYVDVFRFPWLRYGFNQPSAGKEYSLRLQYLANRKTELGLLLRLQSEDQITMKTANEKALEKVLKSHLRLHLLYKLAENISCRSQIDIQYNSASDKGYLMFEELSCSFYRQYYSIIFRYTLFDTDSYDSRIYANERQVPMLFSISQYADQGSAVYFLFKIRLRKNITIWSRFSHVHYNNKAFISSGLTEIEGNTKNEIALEIKYSF